MAPPPPAAPPQDPQPEPLQPFEYPAWVHGCGVVIFLLIAYSLALFPKYLKASQNVHRGESAIEREDFGAAVAYYKAALEMSPTSEKALVGYTEAAFAARDQRGVEDALKRLDDVTLSDDEWAQVSRYMPPDVQKRLMRTGERQ